MIGWVAAVFACLVCLRVGWVWRRNDAVIRAARLELDLGRTQAALDAANGSIETLTGKVARLTVDLLAATEEKTKLRRQLDAAGGPS